MYNAKIEKEIQRDNVFAALVNVFIFIALVAFFWEKGAYFSLENLLNIAVALLCYMVVLYMPIHLFILEIIDFIQNK